MERKMENEEDALMHGAHIPVWLYLYCIWGLDFEVQCQILGLPKVREST